MLNDVRAAEHTDNDFVNRACGAIGYKICTRLVARGASAPSIVPPRTVHYLIAQYRCLAVTFVRHGDLLYHIRPYLLVPRRSLIALFRLAPRRSILRTLPLRFKLYSSGRRNPAMSDY